MTMVRAELRYCLTQSQCGEEMTHSLSESYRLEYCWPSMETALKTSLFCVIVPVLSEKTYPIWPRSSLMVNVRQLIGFSYFSCLSLPMAYIWRTRTMSKETYKAMGTITWKRMTKRKADVKKWPAACRKGLSTMNGTKIHWDPNERSQRSDKPAPSKQINRRMTLEKSTSRLMYCSISACLLDAVRDDLMIFVWLLNWTLENRLYRVATQGLTGMDDDASIEMVDVIVGWIALQFKGPFLWFLPTLETQWNTLLLQIDFTIDGSRVQIAGALIRCGRDEKKRISAGMVWSAYTRTNARDDLLRYSERVRTVRIESGVYVSGEAGYITGFW